MAQTASRLSARPPDPQVVHDVAGPVPPPFDPSKQPGDLARPVARHRPSPSRPAELGVAFDETTLRVSVGVEWVHVVGHDLPIIG